MGLHRTEHPRWWSAPLATLRGFLPHRSSPHAPPARARRPASADDGEPLDDALTGCKTRLGFATPLASAFDRAEAGRRALSLLCVGVDDLVGLSDAFGADVGDRVLAGLARRMQAFVRQPMPVGRIASDEFVLAIEGDGAVARRVAAELLTELARPFGASLDGIATSCSIGIAVHPDHGSRHRIMGYASIAMRAARRQGGGGFAEYDPRMGEDQREQQELARDVRSALEGRQFELFYQPKIDARTLKVTAAEALLRWHHPTRGIVSPAVFVPIAERHRLIVPIGDWVIEEATRQAAVWRDAGLRMRVAINVSGHQMRRGDFAGHLGDALRRNRLQAGRFTCEITESVAMEDTEVTRSAFDRLGRLGVHVSIDDFGTGFSGLASLRRLPAQELKVDRAFVADIESSPEARQIVNAVVQMARALGLHVVAEGVETRAQCECLVALGCDELQGYLFARPMSARALGIWAAGDSDVETIAFRSSLFKPTNVGSELP